MRGMVTAPSDNGPHRRVAKRTGPPHDMVIPLNMSFVTPVLKVVSGADQAPLDARIARLRDEWLDGFKSQETRRGYWGDHAAWLTYCAGHGIDPLAARRVDVNRWARALEAAGAKPRSVARRR